jgi:hypothetical protein
MGEHTLIQTIPIPKLLPDQAEYIAKIWASTQASRALDLTKIKVIDYPPIILRSGEDEHG